MEFFSRKPSAGYAARRPKKNGSCSRSLRRVTGATTSHRVRRDLLSASLQWRDVVERQVLGRAAVDTGEAVAKEDVGTESAVPCRAMRALVRLRVACSLVLTLAGGTAAST